MAVVSCVPASAAPPRTASVPPSVEPRSTNAVCAALRDRFIGLPARSAPASAGSERGPAPLAGHWWVRGCTLELGRNELILGLHGPAWYWVDSAAGDFGLRQQVGFDIDAELAGTVQVTYRSGVVSLRFEPTREPVVVVRASDDLHLYATSAWAELLRLMPFVPIRARVAEGLAEQASASFRDELARGATVTYDVGQDQADLALEQLASGTTPERAFKDGMSWLVNDRLLLPPGATHAFGPVEPAPEYHLDAINETGGGLEYRALCARDMAANFGPVMDGTPDRIRPEALVASGRLLGSGRHGVTLHVANCPFFIVISPAPDAKKTTLTDLRLRV